MVQRLLPLLTFVSGCPDDYKDDPVAASTEYGALFRSHIAAFLPSEWIDAAISENLHERKPMPDIRYDAFVDPSGGASDAFTLGISHNEDGTAVLDALRGRSPPFNPASVVAEFATLLKDYRLNRGRGDPGGQWPSWSTVQSLRAEPLKVVRAS